MSSGPKTGRPFPAGRSRRRIRRRGASDTAAIGLWIGATTTFFANATVTVKRSPNLSGEYAAYVAELSWFPAIYVAANSCANTMLVKARAQFSMQNVMRVLLLVYIAVAAMQFFVTGFAAEAKSSASSAASSPAA